MNYLDEIKKAVEACHGCMATHVSTVPVKETFNGAVAWEGLVEVFALTGHPKAQRCYAWGYPDKGAIEAVTVLEIPPVTSPQTAVKAAIVSEARRRRG